MFRRMEIELPKISHKRLMEIFNRDAKIKQFAVGFKYDHLRQEETVNKQFFFVKSENEIEKEFSKKTP